MSSTRQAAERVLQRCDLVAFCSEDQDRITRRFATDAHRDANDLVCGWMHELGMNTRIDAVGNLVGRWDPSGNAKRTLMIGSHLDSVRGAGRYDGVLGVILGLAVIESLMSEPPPFAIEVVAFADEEGVRFGTAYLGSSALAGCFDESVLTLQDRTGVSLKQALLRFGGDPDAITRAFRDPTDLIGYIEPHIEQGPVLDTEGLPVAIVSAIAGQTRALIGFHGQAGHSGTVPMDTRKDALLGAAEWALAVENEGKSVAGLVATVGNIAIDPGVGNVIAGSAQATLDIRHADDSVRRGSVEALRTAAVEIAKRRGLMATWHPRQETAAVHCSPELTDALAFGIEQSGVPLRELASGAGHDAAVMANVTQVGMLFLRCKDGLSHHPNESVSEQDVETAIGVLVNSVRRISSRSEFQGEQATIKAA